MKNKKATVLSEEEVNLYLKENGALQSSASYFKNLQEKLRDETIKMQKDNKNLPCVKDEISLSHEICKGCDERVKSLVKYSFLLKSLKEGHIEIKNYLQEIEDLVKSQLNDIGVEFYKLDPNENVEA